MAERYYTSERNVQMVIAVLKANNIKKIITSPGATNITFVGSIQNDPFFEIYSCVDERSAAYMACGMAAESGEPVVINCTGATSSRNWMPGLTEAFYRKLPILAVSSSQETNKVGHLVAQVTDRSTPPCDTVITSLEVGLIKSASDEWDATIKLNKAVSLLTRNGGGPVHINLITNYSKDYSVRNIEPVRIIKRYTQNDSLPSMKNGRIAIAVGSHRKFTPEEVAAIDSFCKSYDSVVFCDHSSGYNGEYKANLSLSIIQKNYKTSLSSVDLLIHIGEVSGDYNCLYRLQPKEVWRVSPDGEMRDLYKKLTAVFDMREDAFFAHYTKEGSANKHSYFDSCEKEYEEMYSCIPELPFSNLWIAKKTAPLIPTNSVLHLGILNSLRSWNFFKVDNTIDCSSNAGGFGIDGVMSTLIGASLCNKEKLYFCVIGDLAFFYDLNSIGNRHIGNNVRILLINNGRGQEFRNYTHDGNIFREEADKYIAAAGHFGYMSQSLVKGISESLGYKYLTATNKEEFCNVIDEFTSTEPSDKPIILEVFTDTTDESNALEMISLSKQDKEVVIKHTIKKVVNNIFPHKSK